MDGTRIDALARKAGAMPSRRTLLQMGVRAALGVAIAALSSRPEDVAAGRNACEVRCGGDRRLCRADCRDKGVSERQCKRTCDIWRDFCNDHCAFKPLRKRLVNDEYDKARRRGSWGDRVTGRG